MGVLKVRYRAHSLLLGCPHLTRHYAQPCYAEVHKVERAFGFDACPIVLQVCHRSMRRRWYRQCSTTPEISKRQ